MVVASQVQKPVEEEDFYLCLQAVTVFFRLAPGAVERDGQIAGLRLKLCVDPDGGKRKDVGGLILAAEFTVELLQRRIVCEEDVDFPGQADASFCALNECIESLTVD